MQFNLILTTLFMTILFIMVLYPIALKTGLIDHPCHRKQHKEPTPLIGGLATYLAILVTMSINEGYFPHQFAYILASTLLVCVGLVDDYKGLGVRVRIVAQIMAVLIMTELADLKITDLGDIAGFGNIHLGVFATAFTIFAVVGGINAFNMIDGIDGLAGGLTLTSIATIAAIAWWGQDLQLFNFCCLLIAAIIGFLIFNLRIFGRSNAKIFLGDTGSTLFGFTVCWLAIYTSQGEHKLISPALVLWIMAVPLIDSVCIMCRRLSKGRSPFAADREHLHHILTVAGYSVNQVLLRLLAFSLILCSFGVTAGFILNYSEEVLFALFLIFFAGYYGCMSHAWTMMKIARYLHMKREGNEISCDRRKAESRTIMDITVDRRAFENRRVITERRYIPSQEQLMAAYRLEQKLKNVHGLKKFGGRISAARARLLE